MLENIGHALSIASRRITLFLVVMARACVNIDTACSSSLATLNAAQRALKGLKKSDTKKGAFPNQKFRRIETLSTKKCNKNKILRQSLVEKVNKFTKLKGTIY
jgi:hypothetical protein